MPEICLSACLSLFEARFHYVAQVEQGMELVTLLPQPPTRWDASSVPAHVTLMLEPCYKACG